MKKTFEELKTELRNDFGKITCWKWLCKEQNATTEQDKIAVAEQVLAMPRMNNVAAAQTYWLRLHGKRTRDIRDILAGRYRASGEHTATPIQSATGSGRSAHELVVHQIRSECDLDHVRRLCGTLITQRRGKTLGEEILQDLDSGYINAET